jgi:hypothetical protein
LELKKQRTVAGEISSVTTQAVLSVTCNESGRDDQKKEDVDLSIRQEAKENGGISALSLTPQGGRVLEKDVL